MDRRRALHDCARVVTVNVVSLHSAALLSCCASEERVRVVEETVVDGMIEA